MLDTKIMLSSFGLIFLAELGDKTQLTTMGLTASAGNSETLSILIGSVAGISCATILGVAAGRLLSQWLNPEWLRIGGGCLFLVFGALLLMNRMPK
jgi:putative Ca2+/H+ antiporter (TMEM165/GDT1 family)